LQHAASGQRLLGPAFVHTGAPYVDLCIGAVYLAAHPETTGNARYAIMTAL